MSLPYHEKVGNNGISPYVFTLVFHGNGYIDKGELPIYNSTTMGKKRKSAVAESEEVKVSLKPLFGIKPGIYLAILYSFILLLVLFFLLLFPGITNRGKRFQFESNVPGAAVYIDGAYAGITPFTAFVPAGEYSLEYRKQFFHPDTQQISVRGPIFASLFFPGKESNLGVLELQDRSGFMYDAVTRYSSWSMVDGFYQGYQPPPIAEDMVRSLFPLYSPSSTSNVPSKQSNSDSENTSDTVTLTEKALVSMMLSTSQDYQVRDLLKAYVLFHSQGSALTSSSFLSCLETILRISSEYPGFFLWALEFAGSDGIEKISQLPEFTDAISTIFESLTTEDSYSTSSSASSKDTWVQLKNCDFIPVKGGEYAFNSSSEDNSGSKGLEVPFDSIPPNVKVADFYIQRTEVSIGDFLDFLEENPQWKKENLPSLLEQNLVTEDYLLHFPDSDEALPSSYSLPITHISWYAAKAYCLWLTESLPPFLSNYQVRLPREEEWEWVSRLEKADDGDQLFIKGINGPVSVLNNEGSQGEVLHLLGNVWEWCADWYYLGEYFFFAGDGKKKLSMEVQEIPAAEKVVRGGSWANMPHSIQPTTRGSQPPVWCTPFLGFRPVIAKLEELSHE